MSYVYFMRERGGGPVKIGKANNPGARLAQFQCGNPRPLEIVGVCKAGHLAEKLFHGLFADLSLGKEWFAQHDRLDAFIAKLPTWSQVLDGIEPPELQDDTACLSALYAEGYSLREIGHLFGYTGEYIRQKLWLANNNIEKPDARPELPIAEAYRRISTNADFLALRA